MIDTYLYTFVQTYGMYNLRMDPEGSYGLRVIEMGQCRFISYYKSTIPVWDVIDKGGCTHVGMRIYGKSLYLPLNFAMNLKLL